MRIITASFISLALACAGAAAFAEGASASKAADPRHQGFYFGMPQYLYGTDSAFGPQLGCQLGNLQLRLDASVVADSRGGEVVLFANPSIGAFYSEDWEANIRTYQGISFGIQKGLLNSFEGLSCFLNVLAGAEWFAFKRKAFFLEIGSCVSGPERDGNLKNGTVIGGGIKCFF
jgi:hypothetical protein